MRGAALSEATADLHAFGDVVARCIVVALRCDRCGVDEVHVAPDGDPDAAAAEVADELGWISDDQDLCPDCAEGGAVADPVRPVGATP